ncbi:hypothetical protein [Aquimarina rhabdastrellae]
MIYKVIPFIATLHQKSGNTNYIAQQLENLINQYADDGWSYDRIEHITLQIKEQKGFLGINHTTTQTQTKQMVVFKK